MFSRDIPHEVLNYRLDLGAVSYVPRDPQLQATEILKDELTLIVPLKHPLAKKREVDVADLGAESFVAHIVESPFRRRVIELFARNPACAPCLPRSAPAQPTSTPDCGDVQSSALAHPPPRSPGTLHRSCPAAGWARFAAASRADSH